MELESQKQTFKNYFRDCSIYNRINCTSTQGWACLHHLHMEYVVENFSSFLLWWQQHITKKLKRGQQKAGKEIGAIKYKLRTIRQQILVTWQQVCDITGIKGAFQWGRGKCKTVLWSGELKSEIIFGNHWHQVLQTKDERDHPAFISRQFKSCISDGMELHQCLWCGQLTHLERLHQCWRVHRGFRKTCAPIQTCFSGKALNISARPHPSQQHDSNWPACRPELSPTENIWCIIG